MDSGNKKPFMGFSFFKYQVEETNKAVFVASKEQPFPNELNEMIQLWKSC